MIFTGFKRKSNQMFFDKNWKNILAKTSVDSFNKAKNVLVLVNDVSEISEVKSKLSVLLKINEEAIDVLFFQKKIKKNEIIEGVFTPKDFGWGGRIKSEELQNILTKKYDLLINYSKIETIYSNLLILQSKTAFKVGFEHLDKRLYNLLINCDLVNKDLFNSELKKYLEILKKV